MKRLAVILGLFTLTLLYFSENLSGTLLLVERDLTTFFYPFRYIWVESISQGHFPFWNPYIKSGVPLFATIQPGVLYPLSLLYLFLPLDLAFNWTIILHFFLAGVFTYALMRELRASMQGSLLAVVAFLFGGYLLSVHNMLNTLLSVTWYPMVIFCGCRLVQKGQARWAVVSGVSLCFMFLGGGMEIFIFALASFFLLCLYPRILPLEAEEEFASLKRRLILLGLAVVAFFGLSMVQLVPFLELYRVSDRYGGMTLEEATRWSLAPEDLIYFLLPDLYGSRMGSELYWKTQNYLKTFYLGPVCLFLAGIYFFRQGKRTLPLLAAMVLVLVFALGRYTPLYPFCYKYLPLFDTLRYPVKFLFLFVFYLCVTAGLGLDVIRDRFSEQRRPTVWFQGILVAMVLILAGLFLLSRFFPGRVLAMVLEWWEAHPDPAFLPTALHNLNRLLVVSVLVLMVIFFSLRHKLNWFGTTLLLVLVTLDLFLGNRGFAVKLDADKFHADTEIIRTLEADETLFRFHVMGNRRLLRGSDKGYEYMHLRRKDALGYNLMMEHHLFDVDGYNVPQQPRYEKLIGLIVGKPLEPPVPAILDLLNVKYVVSEDPVELPGYVWIRDGLETIKLYENRNYLPRAFLVRDFKVLKTDQEFAQALHDPNFNPRQSVLLEKEPARLMDLRQEFALPLLEPKVEVVSYENNRMVLKISTPEAALLFMSEAYYPGWKAYVDGSEEEILRTNYVFRAIPVGPGSHTVEMVYQPQSFKVGLAMSVLTIVILATVWAIFTMRRGTSGIQRWRRSEQL